MDEQLSDSDGVLPNKLGITDPEDLKTAESGPSTYRRDTPHSAGQPTLMPRNRDSSTSYGANASCAAWGVCTGGKTCLLRKQAECYSPFSGWEWAGDTDLSAAIGPSAGYDLAYRDADEESLMRADIAAFDGNYEQL